MRLTAGKPYNIILGEFFFHYGRSYMGDMSGAFGFG